MQISDIKRVLPAVALTMSMGLMAACSSSGNSSFGSGTDGEDGGEGISERSCAGGQTCGALDPVQEAVASGIGEGLGGALPAPLGAAVVCGSAAVNNVIDVPDALLAGLETAAGSQDPAAMMAAFEDMGASFEHLAYNVEAMLMGLTGSEASCNEAGGEGGLALPGFPGGDGGEPSEGPTGTPLDLALAPLVDGLNSLLAALEDGAAGTPAEAVINPVVDGLSALLAVLQGGDMPALPGGEDNPLMGVLAQLQDQLGNFPGFPGGGDGGGNGGDSQDLDLVPATDVLSSVTEALSMAFNQARTGLEGAAGSEIPVVGGLLFTLETALADLSVLLNAVGPYDGEAVNSAVEVLLENVLVNALTQVIPLQMIGDQTGQDFAGPISEGVNQGVSMLGEGTVLVIAPVFNEVLDDAASPALDHVEALVAQLLASSPVNLGDTLAGGIGQIVDALTGFGGGSDGGSGGPTGTPLDMLLGGLPGSGGGSGGGPTGTPLDLLLAGLVDNDPTGVLAAVLAPLGDLLGLLSGGISTAAP